MKAEEQYEVVIGLEVHARLLTASKLFCGDSNAYGAEPNTHISPITLAHPGSLPRMNRKAVEFAVKTGLACRCEITRKNYFARKNYFYPDLPKGYQVSQHTTPVCRGGFIDIGTADEPRKIRLNRIHLEEDAGRSVHDADEHNTCIDYNRAGTPLIEMVTEPDLRSADEAFAFLTEVRKLVRYLGVCDGNMEEGSLRCDANISVRKKDDPVLGTRVEVKNLNSIRNVKRAVTAEAARLISILESGGTITQETRSFDADKGTSFAIRDKEDADDYRYFPEPDLTPFDLEEVFIDHIRNSLPVLQPERIARYTRDMKLPDYDARVITEERQFADYFEELTRITPLYKAAANWMLGPVRTWLNENQADIADFPLKPSSLAALVTLVDENRLSFSAASGKVFPEMISSPGKSPEEIAAAQNLFQQSDVTEIEPVIDAVLSKMDAKVLEYKKGKKGLLSLFVGEVMKQTRGKADPKIVNQVLLEKLKA